MGLVRNQALGKFQGMHTVKNLSNSGEGTLTAILLKSD